MAQYLVQYIDHQDDDTKKEQILGAKDIDEVEYNLYRKLRLNHFTILNIKLLKVLHGR